MAFKKNSEFKYSIRGVNRIIEEKGNQYIKFTQIAWADESEDVTPDKIKFDIRKYVTDPNGKEKMLKGVSFLTDDGPHELAHILIEEGFGKTDKVLETLKNRSDFVDAVKSCYGEKAKDIDSTFDLRDIL